MTATTLVTKTCTPCRGGVPPLTREEAERYLAETPGWSLSDDATKIERRFKLKNFAAAQALAQRIGDLAEQEGHHPDICYGWGYCRVELQTHKIKGLHENDFIMAAKISELAGA